MPARSWSFAAVPEQVPAVRRAVAEYANEHSIPEPPLADLKLAVTEAVTNAVIHGYRDSEPGTITVAIDVEPSSGVTVRVRDDGEGMRPRTDSPGLGLGLAVSSSVATATEVRTPEVGRGTEVCMRFALDEAG